MIATNKNALRQQLRCLRGPQLERAAQSEALCRHILASDVFRHASVVAGYAALKHEADITNVLEVALEKGKIVLMPLCGPAPHMTLRRIQSLGELVPGRYGIPEPTLDSLPWDVAEVDLILVPLEGIDPDGFRLGKGGGYYDCLLEKTEAYSVGCALSWQHVDAVPREAWDKPLSACADMYGMHAFRR